MKSNDRIIGLCVSDADAWFIISQDDQPCDGEQPLTCGERDRLSQLILQHTLPTELEPARRIAYSPNVLMSRGAAPAHPDGNGISAACNAYLHDAHSVTEGKAWELFWLPDDESAVEMQAWRVLLRWMQTGIVQGQADAYAIDELSSDARNGAYDAYAYRTISEGGTPLTLPDYMEHATRMRLRYDRNGRPMDLQPKGGK
jgi:hypothetical protein